MYTSVQFLYYVLTSQSDLPGYKLNFVVWDEYNLDVNNNFSMKKKLSIGSMHYLIYLTYVVNQESLLFLLAKLTYNTLLSVSPSVRPSVSHLFFKKSCLDNSS